MPERAVTSETPWRPRPQSRRLLFWWPVAAIAGITALLWVAAWPRNAKPRDTLTRQVPEPNAAYVLVGPGVQSLYLKADIIARPSWIGFGRSLDNGLDDRESMAEHSLGPVTFLPDGKPPLEKRVELHVPVRLPTLAERFVATPRWTLPPTAHSLTLSLSPALQQAAFTAAVTRADLPKEAGRMRVWLELDETGRVIHALGETDGTGATPQQALHTLRACTGTNAASGWVDIYWEAAPALP